MSQRRHRTVTFTRFAEITWTQAEDPEDGMDFVATFVARLGDDERSAASTTQRGNGLDVVMLDGAKICEVALGGCRVRSTTVVTKQVHGRPERLASCEACAGRVAARERASASQARTRGNGRRR